MQRPPLLPFSIALALAPLAPFACGGTTDSQEPPPPVVGTDAGVDAPVLVHPDAAPEGAPPDGSQRDVGVDAPPEAGATLLTQVISSAPDSTFESEPHIAVAPDGTVGAAWQAISSNNYYVGYAFSKDHGATWGPIAKLEVAAGYGPAGDIVLAADSSSNFYAVQIGLAAAPPVDAGAAFDGGGLPADGVFVAKAPAGSGTFGTGVQVSDPADFESGFDDKPWLTVTPAGTILATWSRVENSGNTTVLIARSTDAVNWSRSVVASDDAFRHMVVPCLSSGTSKVGVAFFASPPTATSATIGLRTSEDEGATWTSTDTLVSATTEAAPVGFSPVWCVIQGSDVWISYGLSHDSFAETNILKLVAVRLAHSSDGGQTFTDHQDLQLASDGAFFLNASLAREVGGALDVTYYAGAGEGDSHAKYVWRRAADGKTFGPSTAVATEFFTTSRTSSEWVGDYDGLAADTDVFMIYADNLAGNASHAAVTRATP